MHTIHMHTRSTASSSRNAHKNVLIADGDISTRAALSKVIDHIGYRSVMANNGQDALQVMQSHDTDPFSLLIADVHMPVMDGIELAQELRSQGIRIPIIFISSGLGAPGQYSKAHLEAISPYYLERPVARIPAFHAMITGILGIDEEREPV